MPLLVLVVPDLVGPVGCDSVCRGLPHLAALSSESRVSLLAPEAPTGCPESAWLGLNPETIQVEPGPLIVAALGAKPPDRAVLFHLSLASLADERVQPVTDHISPESVRSLQETLGRLNARKLSVVFGDALDHGLVWEEGSLECGTTPLATAVGKHYRDCWPEGDGEAMLRAFIEDSHELLARLEFNLRRADEGLATIDLAWPWGQGLTPRMPNLALRWLPTTVLSDSLRLTGLARLGGLVHRRVRRSGLDYVWPKVADLGEQTIFSLGSFRDLRRAGRLEEAEWLARRLDEAMLSEIRTDWPRGKSHLVILSPSSDGFGLVLERTAELGDGGRVPFDERALEDSRLPVHAGWEAVARVMDSCISSGPST